MLYWHVYLSCALLLYLLTFSRYCTSQNAIFFFNLLTDVSLLTKLYFKRHCIAWLCRKWRATSQPTNQPISGHLFAGRASQSDQAPDEFQSKTQRGRRVKQPHPTRSASRDDVGFRGVICRFVMTFDGRQAHLNIATEFRYSQRRTGSSNRPWLSRQTGPISSGVTRNSVIPAQIYIKIKPSFFG